MNPWEQIKQQLETALNPDSYRNWVSRTSFGQLAGGVLRVSVPTVESKAWMETEYANQVGAIIRKLNLRALFHICWFKRQHKHNLRRLCPDCDQHHI